ncbi:unnamed protein product [Auanema sp. JU1783]|nr:unnamed protein product [Auanema sp. JU1783]
MSHDGWKDFKFPIDKYVQYYYELDEISKSNPVVKVLDTLKARERKTIVDEHGIVVSFFIDEEEHVHKRFFKPSLQSQRNSFTLRCLKEFFEKRGEIHTIGIMGCGAYSFERFSLHQLPDMGVKVVRSVDICPETLEKGFKALKSSLSAVHSMISGSVERPSVLEQYYGKLHCLFTLSVILQGDITDADERFIGIDCVCSTEVIEHMPLSVAEDFVRNVLGNLQPKLFVLSTPNYEYNVAFGSSTFRHDDHKFEFSRKEFDEWISKVSKDYPYEYIIHYVGNVEGYENLSGATQFAVLSRKENVPIEDRASKGKIYEKVGQSILFGGLSVVIKNVCKDAFKKFLELHPLHHNNLRRECYGKFWEVDVDDVMALVAAPDIIKERITSSIVMHVSHELLE